MRSCGLRCSVMPSPSADCRAMSTGTDRWACLDSGSSTTTSSSASPGPDPGSRTHAAPHSTSDPRKPVSDAPPAAASRAPRASEATDSISRSDRHARVEVDTASWSEMSTPETSTAGGGCMGARTAAGAWALWRYSNSASRPRSTASRCAAASARMTRPLMMMAGEVCTDSASSSEAWLSRAASPRAPASKSGEAGAVAGKMSESSSESIGWVTASCAWAAAKSSASSRRAVSSADGWRDGLPGAAE
mmetsp:Transcript_7426/g.24355  ORF Transcript_7426/g.24355 Transcript_7426/m.24355 type:complete len:247 (-) Transcript_7426:932-1672(-)|eukprot:scaffold14357_cov101-Isochrysis_galbana.AAC.6